MISYSFGGKVFTCITAKTRDITYMRTYATACTNIHGVLHVILQSKICSFVRTIIYTFRLNRMIIVWAYRIVSEMTGSRLRRIARPDLNRKVMKTVAFKRGRQIQIENNFSSCRIRPDRLCFTAAKPPAPPRNSTRCVTIHPVCNARQSGR